MSGARQVLADGGDTQRDVRPFKDLVESGLLMMINLQSFHPRGMAFALVFDDEGVAVGWYLVGEGDELWQFAISDKPSPEPDSIDGRWRAANATLAEAARANKARRIERANKARGR